MTIFTTLYNFLLRRSEERPKTDVDKTLDKHLDTTLGPLVK